MARRPRYAASAGHKSDPRYATTSAIIDAVHNGTISPEDAAQAFAEMPIDKSRGNRTGTDFERHEDPVSEPYGAFHPLDMWRSATIRKYITREQNHAMKARYSKLAK